MISKELSNQAACKGNTSLFFSDDGPLTDKAIRSAIKKAKGLCSSCPIQIECLLNSINAAEDFGIWGGFTTRERRKMFRGKDTITYGEAFEAVKWIRSI